MRDRVLQPAPAPAPRAKAAADGLSAFELARSKGYRGTLEQWLASLKGEPGQSVRGPKGEPGDDGRDAVLVDADVEFDRDQETKLTLQARSYADDGTLLCTITPIRDADDFMIRARIEVAG